MVVRRADGRLGADRGGADRMAHPAHARFMVPRYIEFIDALPKTPTDRVKKKDLRERGGDGRGLGSRGRRHRDPALAVRRPQLSRSHLRDVIDGAPATVELGRRECRAMGEQVEDDGKLGADLARSEHIVHVPEPCGQPRALRSGVVSHLDDRRAGRTRRRRWRPLVRTAARRCSRCPAVAHRSRTCRARARCR